MVNTRELAVSMLTEILENGEYCHLIIHKVLDKYDYMESRDKAFLKRLTEGCVERKIQLDHILDLFSKTPVSQMKPFIRNLLRMSLYQILFMDNVPDGAACNEAVKLARKRGFQSLSGFVNGVLRNIARKKNEIAYPDPEEEGEAYLSVRYSMPDFLVKRLVRERGRAAAEDMFMQYLESALLSVRLKEHLPETVKKELLSRWEKEGIAYEVYPHLPYAYRIAGIAGVKNLPGYEEGLVIVQDVSSMLVCEVAGIKKGDVVMDICAAPGGKAMHAAEKLDGEGMVIARDLTEYKTALLAENRKRMGYAHMRIETKDARILSKEDIETADVVLADLPCSGIGIIGRKSDIKYHITEEGMKELVKLQREILSCVWQYVKPGGVLIYSTCTVNREENEENAAWFAKQFPFVAEGMQELLPEPIREDAPGRVQLLPGVYKTDGFFIAKFRRKTGSGNGAEKGKEEKASE